MSRFFAFILKMYQTFLIGLNRISSVLNTVCMPKYHYISKYNDFESIKSLSAATEIMTREE